MSEDIIIKARQGNPITDLNFSPEMFNKAFILLEDRCKQDLIQLDTQLPQSSQYDMINTDLMREKEYNIEKLHISVESNKS